MGESDDVDASERAPELRLGRHLSERSPVPLVAVEGPLHVVVYVNPAFARLVGAPADSLVGRPYGECVPEGEGNGCMALLGRVFRTGVAESLAEQEHQQAEPAWWSYTAWAVPAQGERLAGVLFQVTDSTEVARFRSQAREMNEALLVSAVRQHELAEEAASLTERLSAAVRARDHFLAALSHELRNPLSPLSAGLALLKRAGPDRHSAETLLMLDRQLKHLVRLVNDLLDVSRIRMGKLIIHKEQVDLAAVVRDAVEASGPFVRQEGHELTVVLPPGPLLLDADPTRLTQVLLNLLNNAAKYSDRGGHITISARRDGDELLLSVRDEGIGIPASYLPHVFEDFTQVDTTWQRAQGGLGMGLALVKEFVGLHGGRVEAHSDGPGKGSEFAVHLPWTTACAPPVGPAETQRGAPRRVLVVDDNRDAASTLAMLLELKGHEVREAHSGPEGITTAAEFQPEIILMDLGMPTMDGYEAARRIRAEPWGTGPLLVALTGWGSEEVRRQAQAAGFDVHMVKPVNLESLTSMFEETRMHSGRSQ